ncbi:hypothetical protein LCGC14_3022370, partial [marine sediment metagenome]
AWIYALLPFSVFTDRLGIPDGMVAALAPFVLWAGLKLGREPSWYHAAMMTFVLGLALMAKATALTLIPVAVVGLALGAWSTLVPEKYLSPHQDSRSNPKSRFLYIIAPISLALAIVPTVVIVKIFSGGSFVVEKSSSFLLSVEEILGFPTVHWSNNFALLREWIVNYIQWPSLIILVLAIVLTKWRIKWWIFVVMLLGGFQIVFMGFMARVWFSRYLAGAIPFLVLAVGMACVALAELAGRGRSRVAVVLLLLAVITTTALAQDVRLISKPTEFSWARDDRWQYIQGWPSGYGFNELTIELDKRIKRHKKIVILVDKYMGHPKDAVELAFSGNKNVSVTRGSHFLSFLNLLIQLLS